MAVIKLCNDILWAMENQQPPAFIAIDLSAAFNTVDHDVTAGNITLGKMHKNYKSLPLELFRALVVGA